MSNLNLSWSVFCSGIVALTTSVLVNTLGVPVIYPFESKSTSITVPNTNFWYLDDGVVSVIVYVTVFSYPLLSKSATPIPLLFVITDSSFVPIEDSTLYVVPTNFILLSLLSTFSMLNCTAGYVLTIIFTIPLSFPLYPLSVFSDGVVCVTFANSTYLFTSPNILVSTIFFSLSKNTSISKFSTFVYPYGTSVCFTVYFLLVSASN